MVDLYDAKWILVMSLAIAVVLTLIYVKFLDWFAFWLAWISVAVIQLAFILLGWFMWEVRSDFVSDTNTSNDKYTKYLLWATIASWVLALGWYIFIACNFRSLKVSIAIIETAADWFADTKRIILVPMAFFGLGILMLVAWIVSLAGVSSLGEISVDSVQHQGKNVEWDQKTEIMIYFMCFGAFWLAAFLITCNEFVVIVSTCTWYFSRKDIPDDDGIPGDSEVYKGFWWAIRYHMGSIAFGSFILAIVWVIQSAFEYVGNKVEKASGNNGCVKCLLGGVRCCLDCFDRFVRFLNRNAYIYQAISNENFCSSAVNAFILVLKNSAKFTFVHTIGSVFMIIAKVCIAIVTTVICYFVMKDILSNQFPYVPLAVIFLCSYGVASVFISVFEVSANTILQCYLIDLDISK